MQFNNAAFDIQAIKSGTAKTAFTALSVIMLSACATTKPATASAAPSFGKAVTANLNAQKVAPSAKQKADTFIPANRARRELARQAYEENTLEELPELGTTDVD